MVERNTFTISAINNKETKHLSIYVNKAVHALILQRRDDIEVTCQGKEGNELVITSKGKKEPLHTSNLDRKLNRVLRETSKVVRKYLKTHTFRTKITTSLIKVERVEGAQRIIGGANLYTYAV